MIDMSNIVAIDTEMVRCRANSPPNNSPSDNENKTDLVFVAAQVSVITLSGKILLNTYAKPDLEIVDYNTAYSGITEEKLKTAPALRHVRRLVLRAIQGKLLVGHAVYNDLQSLGIEHPTADVIDIQQIPAIQLLVCKSYPKLKHVTKLLLKRDIQTGSHCSLEDATATADIFSYALKVGWV